MRVLPVACLMLLCVAAAAAPNEAAIADVAAGRQQRAIASWWDPQRDDGTAALQAALDSGAREVVVDDIGGPWIITGVQVRSNTTVSLAPGVEIQAKRGAFLGGNDCLVALRGVENVVLRGPGASLRMWRDDYADATRYRKAEWRHSVSIMSCSNIAVEGLRLTESGGDGVYLGVSERGRSNEGIVLRDLVCERHYRQGISVISAKRLLIERVVMVDTQGTAPAAGIDFEPNYADEPLVDCVLRDCELSNNQGCGALLALASMDGSSEPVSVRFERCQIIGNGDSVYVGCRGYREEGVPSGSIEFVGCTLRRAADHGLEIANKPASGPLVTLRDCLIEEPGLTSTTAAPIVIDAGRGNRAPAGGLRMDGTTIIDPLDRAPIRLKGLVPVLGVDRISGSLVRRGYDGVETEYSLDEQTLRSWNPGLTDPTAAYRATALAPPDGEPRAADLSRAKVRGEGRWLVYARRGESVTCRAAHRQVGAYPGQPLPVVATGAAGAEVGRVLVALGQSADLVFTAPETGTYTIVADPGANAVALGPCSHPLLLDVSRAVGLYQATGDLWLWAPGDAKAVSVVIAGSDGEAVDATLAASDGEVMAKAEAVTVAVELRVERPLPAAGQALRLSLTAPKNAPCEDYTVEVRGVPAYLAGSPEGLLVPVE